MLAIHDLRKVAWRRLRARQLYIGYLTLTDETVRLSGHEEATGIGVALSIPRGAIQEVRLSWDQLLAGERSIVLGIADGEPILVTPVDSSEPEVDRLARRLADAAQPAYGSAATD